MNGKKRTPYTKMACFYCKEKHQKCDGQKPTCTTCLRKNLQCNYRPERNANSVKKKDQSFEVYDDEGTHLREKAARWKKRYLELRNWVEGQNIILPPELQINASQETTNTDLVCNASSPDSSPSRPLKRSCSGSPNTRLNVVEGPSSPLYSGTPNLPGVYLNSMLHLQKKIYPGYPMETHGIGLPTMGYTHPEFHLATPLYPHSFIPNPSSRFPGEQEVRASSLVPEDPLAPLIDEEEDERYIKTSSRGHHTMQQLESKRDVVVGSLVAGESEVYEGVIGLLDDDEEEKFSRPSQRPLPLTNDDS
eukprot:TRINITY_DN10924_c0_g1_i2.p1 TRINITY_DN10924_c0_g1~~TRINITY_DN10924_c0_g1_i2.p1  ORF type:complete len:305 (-),score=47.03 TRINITY_DN10924_c0_g1_i2:55-969(-)